MAAEPTFRIVIVGGGTAGITVAACLARRLPVGSIAIVEPNETHWYQPLWTLVGAGEASLASTQRSMASVIPPGVTWLKQAATGFDPASRIVHTTGERIRYDFLIVAPGIQIDWQAIPGLEAALKTFPNSGVVSNYSERYVENTWAAIKGFRGGTALFTFPATPVKCAGAPQKIMYLAEDYFRRRSGVRDKTRVAFFSAIDKIFGVKKYADALTRIVEARGIETNFKHNLVAVDGVAKIATFKNLNTDANIKVPYEVLHVTPPMSAPAVVRQSPLASAAGWVDVDKMTLQHVRYENVFAIGDASSLPTSKTGAAIRKQAVVLVTNLLDAMRGNKLAATYNGYTSCPLVTGYERLILAEFDYEGRPCETFPFDQSQERYSMYLLKKYGLPALYWNAMLKGYF